MRKALILGAGGTGARVIDRLRDMVEWRNDKSINEIPNIQHYEIDTTTESITDGGINSLHLKVSNDQVMRFKNDMDSGHHKWADRTGITSVTDGAGETRVKGKFAFLYHYDYIKAEIENRLKSLYAANETESGNQKKRIYIVANSVSGTGSGCFVDYGYLVREVIRENVNYRNDTLLNITLILTLPVRYNNLTHLRNSYHALEELNHYMSGNSYSIEHAICLDETIRGNSSFPLFDYVYLIGPRNSKDSNDNVKSELESQDLENVIGEYIYNDIFSPSANIRDSARDNMNKYENSKDKMGYCQRYMTFGFSTIEYPMVQISKASTYKYLLDSLNEWRKDTDAVASPSLSTFFLKDGSYKTEGSIYFELLKEAVIPVHGGSSKLINVEDMIVNLKRKAFEEFKITDYNSSKLTELIDNIDECFKTGFVSNDHGKGTIKAVIQENIRRLKSDANGWAVKIKSELLKIVFNECDGLRLAKNNLDIIIKRLDEIANDTADETPSDVRNEIVALCNEIETIRTDNLLKFCGLHTFPRNQRIAECQQKIDQYIDLKLRFLVINVAKNMASFDADSGVSFGLRESIDKFKARLNNFENDIDTWIVSLSNDYSKAVNPPEINGHIVWRDKIDYIAQTLITNSRKKMSDLIGGSFQDLFKSRLFQDSDAISDSVCIKKRDKKEIVDSQRGFFIELLGDKKVIDEFLKEEQDRTEGNKDSTYDNDVIVEVRDKAKPFIDKRPSENLVGDKSTLEKVWYFYPGGQEVSEKNSHEINFFASELSKRRLVTNWSEQSQNSSDDRIILMLEEQAGFPLHLLNMVSEDQTRKALTDAQDLIKVGINTFISRVDVEFLPLTIENPQKLNAAKLLFIESIATGSLTFQNECFVYGQANSEAVFGVHGILRLPNHYRNAVYKLYCNESAQSKLRKENDKYIKNDLFEFLRKLRNLLINYRSYGLVLSEREVIEIKWLIEDYIKQRGLIEDWQSAFPSDGIGENNVSHFTYIEKVDPNSPEYPAIGWYCNKCNQFMGDETVEGKPDSEAEIKFKKIHICNL